VSTGRRAWQVAWRLAVCLLLLAWIFQAIFYNEGRITFEQAGGKWQELTRWERFEVAWEYGPIGLWNTLSAIDLKYLLLSIALMAVILFLGVIRWQAILRVHGIAMPLGRSVEISLVGHFFNSFLLGSVGGDLLKAYYVARETHHKKTEAVVTVVVDRVIGLFSMLILACLLAIPNIELLTSSRRMQLVLLIISGMTLACTGFILLSFWGGVSKGLPKARIWLRKLPKGEMLERTLEAFREFGRDRWFLLRVLPVSMLSNLVCVAHFLVLLRGFGLDAPVLAIAVIVPMVTCISTLPITPSGLGVRENLYVWMLAAPLVNIPPAEALLVSLVGYATSLFWSVIGGLVYATVKKKEHLEEIESEAAANP
jgi:glycosyltransferase 2 family protein